MFLSPQIKALKFPYMSFGVFKKKIIFNICNTSNFMTMHGCIVQFSPLYYFSQGSNKYAEIYFFETLWQKI